VSLFTLPCGHVNYPGKSLPAVSVDATRQGNFDHSSAILRDKNMPIAWNIYSTRRYCGIAIFVCR